MFEHIYEKRVWLNGREDGALSGLGSEVDATLDLRDNLAKRIREMKANSILDVGCGDFTWMRHVDLDRLTYTGIDIVKSVIDENNSKFASDRRVFRCMDVVREVPPSSDIAICREVLFHLSFTDSQMLLRNIKLSGAKFLIATSDTSTRFNSDITTGDFRRLNLQRRPFNLPVPSVWIPDEGVAPGRGLGVWPVTALQLVERRSQLLGYRWRSLTRASSV